MKTNNKICFVVCGIAVIAYCQFLKGVFGEDDKKIEKKRTFAGSCGEIGWTCDSETMTINGSGKMDGLNGCFSEWGNCNSVKKVVIKTGVTSIIESAFDSFKDMTEVSIPSTVTIGSSAFNSCYKLQSIVIPTNVTIIEDATFYQCYGLKSVAFLGNITSIGENAFAECLSLYDISIPSTVETIGFEAFYWCDNLTNVTIPSTTTSIGIGAFAGCESLTSIDVASSNEYFKSDNGVLYNKNGSTLLQYPAGKSGTSYSILTTAKNIQDYAFEHCTNLESITIPSTVSSIGVMAFLFCSGLTSIQLPSGLTHIESHAFQSCSSLTSITIPASVTSIGTLVFEQCTSMTSINVAAGNDYFKSVDGVLFDVDGKILIQYPLMKTSTEYIIPNGVTTIKEQAFDGISYLTRIIIPESVISIGQYVFSSKTLKSICYVGTHPISTSGIVNCDSLTDLCVPPDYPSNVFCQKKVTPNTATCQSFRSMFNRCYKATVQGDILMQVKRDNATQWESQTKGCVKYVCNNDVGGTIELSCDIVPACNVGACNESTGVCTYERVSGWIELEEQENQCYEIGCDESKHEWVLKIRDNASEWISHANGCYEYQCNNESGFVSWNKCNNTGDICVDGECSSLSNNSSHVEVVFDKNAKITYVDVLHLQQEISERYGISSTELTIGVERDSHGIVVRLIIFAQNEEITETLATALEECVDYDQ